MQFLLESRSGRESHLSLLDDESHSLYALYQSEQPLPLNAQLTRSGELLFSVMRPSIGRGKERYTSGA